MVKSRRSVNDRMFSAMAASTAGGSTTTATGRKAPAFLVASSAYMVSKNAWGSMSAGMSDPVMNRCTFLNQRRVKGGASSNDAGRRRPWPFAQAA